MGTRKGAMKVLEVDRESDGRPPHILLVEDQDQAAESLSALLRLNGFAVTRACDGPTALLAARGGDIDVVVLDVMLPGLDGFEVCRRLRTDPATAALVIVMLTGLDDTASKIEGLSDGADDYLVKPIVSLELGTRVRKLVEARDARLREVRQQRLQAIGEIATAICHEINSPLTAALGTVDLLLMTGPLPARIRRELEECQRNLVRIGQILGRLDVVQDRTVTYLGSDRMIDLGTAGAA
jgi:CheY-like chemotaxis protein